jgi:hypothetical protein
MSLEGLLKELDRTRRDEQEKMISLMKEQSEAMIRAKDQEIASLRDEITTLRNWLDHSALPAANPISKRSESMGLIKMNFGRDKPCPEMYSPGEREMLESVRKRESWSGIPGAGFSVGSEEPVFSQSQESPSREPLRPELPHAPLPEREPAADDARKAVGEALSAFESPERKPSLEAAGNQHDFDAELKLPRPAVPGFDEAPAVKKEKKPARLKKRKAASSFKKTARKK